MNSEKVALSMPAEVLRLAVIDANPSATSSALSDMARRLAIILSGVALLSCAKEPPRPDEGVIASRAQVALAPYKGALKSELTLALARGPDAAIDVCSTRAPELSLEHSKDGVHVGRASNRLRNPANAPASWLTPVIDELAKTPSGSAEHRVVSLPDGRWGYAEPIWGQAPCLTCHAESVAPPVDAKRRARYPGDAARGYHAGDFRGVFFAEVDAAPR